jgi:hypothetical protein
MDKYGKIFENIANVMSFYYTRTKLKDDEVLDYLFKHLLLDLYSIEKLLTQEKDERCLLQAYTISRSMIETSMNFMYLLFYKDKRKQYKEDSQLLLFKNEIILINTIVKNDLKQMIVDEKFNFEALCKSIETESFNKLTTNNQQRLLKVIKDKQFKITEKSLNLLNKFFKNEFKPIHSRIESLFIELNNKIKYEDIKQIDIRTVFYQDYNEASQYVHGIFPIRKPQLYNLVRLCCNVFNNIGSCLRKVYNLQLPVEVQNLIVSSHVLLHPEDK